TPYITQAQSLNIFLLGDVSKKYLNNIHFKAWTKGVKSLYYCRSTSIQRADKVSHDVLKADFKDLEEQNDKLAEAGNYEECLACQ
ncbi:MAG: ribonucleotide-diphosphate reductase subunit alpha, partial [Rickettsia endosymbiont of Haemaphysalis japonica]